MSLGARAYFAFGSIRRGASLFAAFGGSIREAFSHFETTHTVIVSVTVIGNAQSDRCERL